MYALKMINLGLLKKNQQLNILFTIIIGLISIFFIYKIAGVISNPIKRLEKMACELKELNLDVDAIKPSSIIEINEASESFNYYERQSK